METGMTLEEIADALGMTRERVRQIERKALLKIRKELRNRGINNYSDLSVEQLVSDVIRSGSRPKE
jgi:DNA-directed RNA polymerase sigma subunit (sigma70/sigma32)